MFDTPGARAEYDQEHAAVSESLDGWVAEYRERLTMLDSSVVFVSCYSQLKLAAPGEVAVFCAAAIERLARTRKEP